MKLQSLPIGGLTSLAGYMVSSTASSVPAYPITQLKNPLLNPNMPVLFPPLPIIKKAQQKLSANVTQFLFDPKLDQPIGGRHKRFKTAQVKNISVRMPEGVPTYDSLSERYESIREDLATA